MTYLNVEEIELAIQNLAAAYPTTTEVILSPHLTHEGRQSRVLRVGTKSVSEVDGVLILGGVHAREWVPPDALISLAADLLEAYAIGTGLVYGGKRFSADDVRQVLQTLNLFIYPCVNPDGRHHSQTNDPLWRKNRRPHTSGGNCIGVDLNRNFDFLWDHLTKFSLESRVSTSKDPCNRNVYRGPSSASEPETQNVIWLLDTYTRIKWHVDVHSAVPVILHSWGSDQNQTTEPSQNFLNSAFDGIRGLANDTGYGEYIVQKDLNLIKTLGSRMDEAITAVRGDSYGLKQAFGLYPTSGASDDYAFSRHFSDPFKTKVYSFTVECGHEFQPTWTEAEEVIREVSASLIAFCLEASVVMYPISKESIMSPIDDLPDLINALRSLGASVDVDPEGNAISVRWGVHSAVTEDGLQLLQQLTTVKELELTGMTDDWLRYLAPLSQLTSLVLGRYGFSRITDAGLKHLSHLTNLRVLHLQSPEISDAGIIHLKSLVDLQKLDVSYSQVTLDGLKQLEGLRSLIYVGVPDNVNLNYVTFFPNLETVYAFRTTDEETQVLVNLKQIRELGIQSTQITDQAIEYLLPLQTLNQLYLYDTQITPQGFAKLRAGLPQCEITS